MPRGDNNQKFEYYINTYREMGADFFLPVEPFSSEGRIQGVYKRWGWLHKSSLTMQKRLTLELGSSSEM